MGWERLQAWWRRRQRLGARGERLAARYLRRQGMTIVARQLQLENGELDLVAVDDRTLVFVEVKTRSSLDAGHPADAVDETKQRQIERLAMNFIRRNRLFGVAVRYDVVAIIWPSGARPTIEHFRGAFDASF